MTTVSQGKTLGGVGAILVLLTAIPSVGWILGIAGFIMILVAVNYISQAVADHKIYSNMIISVLLAIGAIAVGTVTVIGTVFHVLGMGSFVGSNFVLNPNIAVGNWLGLAGAIIAGLVVVWALLIASAVFFRKSLNSISQRVNVKMFETTGLLYLIGAATAIIGVGFLLILVAEILLAISFFSIEEQKVPGPSQVRGIPTS